MISGIYPINQMHSMAKIGNFIRIPCAYTEIFS